MVKRVMVLIALVLWKAAGSLDRIFRVSSLSPSISNVPTALYKWRRLLLARFLSHLQTRLFILAIIVCVVLLRARSQRIP